MKNLLASLLVAVAIVPATITRHDTRDLVAKRNLAYMDSVLMSFETLRIAAVKAEVFSVAVPYQVTDANYPMVFHIAGQLRKAGYSVDIDRANQTLNVEWR